MIATLLALITACANGITSRPDVSDEEYAPGLGEIMAANQMRHIKLWYAGKDANWPLANYEVDELEEGFADAIRFHPEHKEVPRPLTELVPEFTAGPIAALRSAIARENPASFVTAFDSLTDGCNGCHVAAQFSFNVVTRPTGNPYSNQRFTPSKKRPSR